MNNVQITKKELPVRHRCYCNTITFNWTYNTNFALREKDMFGFWTQCRQDQRWTETSRTLLFLRYEDRATLRSSSIYPTAIVSYFHHCMAHLRTQMSRRSEHCVCFRCWQNKLKNSGCFDKTIFATSGTQRNTLQHCLLKAADSRVAVAVGPSVAPLPWCARSTTGLRHCADDPAARSERQSIVEPGPTPREPQIR